MTRNFDDENQEPPQIIIQDLRHSRSDEGGEEEVEEQAEAPIEEAAAEPQEPAAHPGMEVLEAPEAGADEQRESPGMPEHPGHGHGHDHDHDHEHGDGEAPQMDEEDYQQVMQIFNLGLENYQKSQLGIYIQFALIHLGRMPHPVTGLVATDTDKARFAIDLLHLCFSHLQDSLHPQEKQEFQSVLAQLQMVYAQLAGNAPRPPDTEPQA